jgi:hypothetical protein
VFLHLTTVMHCLMTGVRSEKRVIRRFLHNANIVECTYTNLDTTHLVYMVWAIGPRLQTCTAYYCTEYCMQL